MEAIEWRKPRAVAMRHVLEFLVESLEAGRRVVDRAPSRDDLLLEMASGELNGALLDL